MDEKAVSMDIRVTVAVAGDLSDVNVKRLCAELGISRQTFYKWRRRYQKLGLAGLQERSRRPLRSPQRTSDHIQELIISYRKDLKDSGADYGARSIRWNMLGDGITGVPSVSTIWRVLSGRGFIDPNRKRPETVYKRFERTKPNELWQIDATQTPLLDGQIVEIINIVDDYSRAAVASKAVPTCSCATAWQTFSDATQTWGLPAELLSDNGPAFNMSRRGHTVEFQTQIRALGIKQIASRPYHPQTCGKVERYQATLKRWLAAHEPPATLGELQRLLNTFCCWYNTRRPHSSNGGLTPQQKWVQTPRTGPQTNTKRTPDATQTKQVTVKNGRFRAHGYLFYIGVAHNYRTLTVQLQNRHVAVFDADNLIHTSRIQHATNPNQKLAIPPRRSTP